LKILEAMAIGTPVVATTKGAEGLDAQTGEQLFITDEPEEFAETIIKLLTDQHLRHRLATNASRLVREKYDWAVAMPGLLDLLRQVTSK
jgi:glycosyltransferase involved in cell wall biosynthesis